MWYLHEGEEKCIWSFGEETEGNRPLGRPRHKKEYNIDLKEIGWDGMHWIRLAQDMDKWQAL